MDISTLLKRIASFGLWKPPIAGANSAGEASSSETTEVGRVATPERSMRYLYDALFVDPTLRASILDLRHMERVDGRVKKIHRRLARESVKGGLMIEWAGETDERVQTLWRNFSMRCKLDQRAKLESDARGLVMEGNLPLQRVVGYDGHVSALVRMPTETIVPQVDLNGRFKEARRAFVQVDGLSGRELAAFALWQMSITRLDPDNFDDAGAFGRPYLDATRTVWMKLKTTEEDLVVRRRVRAPLRLAHALEGATKEELEDYKAQVNSDQTDLCTDFFSNKKMSVQPVQGDTNLDQIADVAHLLDTFFAGGPAPKGLFGYVGDLSRDVLDDLKSDYYEEIDCLQDTLAWAYQDAFFLELLLQGILPEKLAFTVKFKERRTETPNQRADRALKYQAMGASITTVFEEAGIDPVRENARLKKALKSRSPYPLPASAGGSPKVSITPGNAPKKESATHISNGGG